MATLTLGEKQKLYDILIDAGTAALKRLNPCHLHQNKKGEWCCADGTPCCSGCSHLGPSGCTVNSLACKLWLCRGVRDTYHPAVVALGTLEQMGRANGIPMLFRASKTENFAHLREGA